MLWVALNFPSLPPGALEPIAGWACQFTPRVSLEPPQALLAEVHGSLRYFGGRARLLERVREGLRAMGVEAAMGVAATPRAALWIARAGGVRLEDVPVALAAEGAALELLGSIGVQTVGGVLALPREGLARRCGPALVEALDRALGRRPEPREFFPPPPEFRARLALNAEVTHAEALLFPARRLLTQLEGLLAARQSGIRSFSLELVGEKTLEIGLASPTRDAKRMAELLRERLGRSVLARPVEAIALHAAGFAPLLPASGGLFGDAAREAEGWAQLVERLQARLGAGAVHGLTVVPDHRPEHAWRAVEPGEWDPHELAPPGPRPAWLVEPRPLGEPGFTLLAGPERIECGWWDGDEAKRDYFVARLGDASLAWIYREDNAWFVHGLFA
ncbi:MAG: Y-family DNA polymerase [Betaproteobacteria bacterium]